MERTRSPSTAATRTRPSAASPGASTRPSPTDGLLDVLRNGVKDRGVRLRVAYFKPNLVAVRLVLDGYRANRLTVVRELAYATKQADWGNRLDLTLFLNGIPVATAELKNPLTGQGVEHAKEQYRTDRDPTELIFARRVVANFAVDPDLVFVATQLRGKNTRFLPFNTGSNGPGQPGGAGNPPATAFGTYATSYLWEQVWQRDNWLDLLRALRAPAQGEERRRRARRRPMIFPRYHQWDAVKKLTAHAATHGAGQNYLVMASAGSGKSNTIAWLAHRLSTCTPPPTRANSTRRRSPQGLKPGEPVFDKVIVITDRRNLDAQLRETVGSFEQTAGPRREDRREARGEGRAARQGAVPGHREDRHGHPALLPGTARLPRAQPHRDPGQPFRDHRGRGALLAVRRRRHRRHGGPARPRPGRRLGRRGRDHASGRPTASTSSSRRGPSSVHRAANLSYFAFTATPKAKTLELFGTLDDVDGKATYRPFHTYSMRQAIEEGFILDPLRNYVTYNTYWKLVNQNPDEREVDPSKANGLLARYALTHDSTVAQHAQVIVEHFVAHTAGRLGGRAKSMVVTASRQCAVQMARAIKSYIEDRDYDTKYPTSASWSRSPARSPTTARRPPSPRRTAGCRRARCRRRSRTRGPTTRPPEPAVAGQREYRILVVAEKYQTGFDQPLLTTMYVNKKLTGISAVQTLSRLNRTAERKCQADLAVLDFVNDAEDIQECLPPVLRGGEHPPLRPEPALHRAEPGHVRRRSSSRQEMDEFAAAYFAAEEKAAGSQAKWEKLHAELYRLLSPAVDRFTACSTARTRRTRRPPRSFRADLNDYVRKYGFLAQIVPYRRRRAGAALPLRPPPAQPAAAPRGRRRGHRRGRPQPPAGGEDRRARRQPHRRGPTTSCRASATARAARRSRRSRCCRS